jgi:imidazolonepropionase-like amidohydrolase
MGVEKRRVAMSRMLEGELQAWVNCATAGDVVQALRLAKEFGLKMKLVLGPGTWRAADLVKKSGLPVILKASVILRETDPDSGKEVERNLAKILHDKGVKFAITTDTTTFGRRYLWYQAACLVRYGLPRQDALAAITTTPAKIIGLGDRKGSLAKDKDGDLLVFTSDPLSGRAWVDQAVIGGRIVYERKNDPRLAEIFGNGAK